MNASPGAAVGRAYFDADLAEEKAKEGPVVMVRPFTKPDDVHGMIAAKGILTSEGGATSHAAVVARQFGKPCVVGAASIKIDMEARTMTADGVTVKEGDWISVDGGTGEAFVGQIPTVAPKFEEQTDLITLLGWADEIAAEPGSRVAGQEQLADPRPAGVGQRRLPGGRPPRPHLRRPGHRPVPHRAHVLRGRAPAHRAAHDPGRKTAKSAPRP